MKYTDYIVFSLLVLSTRISFPSELSRTLSDSPSIVCSVETKKVAVYRNPCTLQKHGLLVSRGDFCFRYASFDGVQCELFEFIFPGGVVIPAENLFRRQDISAMYATMVGQQKE